jgi:hypothetical protein
MPFDVTPVAKADASDRHVGAPSEHQPRVSQPTDGKRVISGPEHPSTVHSENNALYLPLQNETSHIEEVSNSTESSESIRVLSANYRVIPDGHFQTTTEPRTKTSFGSSSLDFLQTKSGSARLSSPSKVPDMAWSKGICVLDKDIDGNTFSVLPMRLSSDGQALEALAQDGTVTMMKEIGQHDGKVLYGEVNKWHEGAAQNEPHQLLWGTTEASTFLVNRMRQPDFVAIGQKLNEIENASFGPSMSTYQTQLKGGRNAPWKLQAPRSTFNFGRREEPIVKAAKAGDLAKVKSLANKVDPFILGDVLCDAANYGHLQIVEFLFSELAHHLTDRQSTIRRALYLSTGSGHLDITRFFLTLSTVLQEGHKLTFKDDEGNSLLHVAARGGHLSVVAFLMTKDGISSNDKNKYGNTPFLEAAKNRHLKILELIS